MSPTHTDTEDAVRILPEHFWGGERGDVPNVGDAVQLRGAVCERCAWACFPFQARCAACGGATTDRAYGPRGFVVGSTYVRHTPPDSELAAPYGIVEVELDEGLVVFGTALDTDGPLAQGTIVHAEATQIGADVLSYAFRVAS